MKRGLLKALIMVCLMLFNVCFANNTITSVEISKDNNNNGYNLKVNSSSAIKYKKVSQGNGSIYYEIKNADLSDKIDTKYYNTFDIKSIAIKKIKGDVRIYIEGNDFSQNPVNFVNGIDLSKKSSFSINGFNEAGAGIILLILITISIIVAQIKDKFNSHYNKKVYQNNFYNYYKNNIIKLPKKLKAKPVNQNITINDYQKMQRLKNPYMSQVIQSNVQPDKSNKNNYKKANSF